VPTLFKAWEIAHSDEPGPVFVEIPVNLQMFPGEVPDIPAAPAIAKPQRAAAGEIRRAAEMLLAAKKPALFLGWGARDAYELTRAIAELLQAPVATTLQGLSVFPANHPLHTGFGFGAAAVPAARNAFAGCDGMLAVGTRFAEIATGSFGVTVPPNLVHVDINPQVFSANYPAAISLEGDAVAVLSALLDELAKKPAPRARRMPNSTPASSATRRPTTTNGCATTAAARSIPRCSSTPCARPFPTTRSPWSTTATTPT
jgi:acetolactate synthase-1/2/3 large subunit